MRTSWLLLLASQRFLRYSCCWVEQTRRFRLRFLGDPCRVCVLHQHTNITNIHRGHSYVTKSLQTKLMEPRGSQVTQTLDILVSHISKHYTQYRRSHTASLIRHSVFTLFLSLRVDKTGRVGIEGETFSSYVFCSEK